MVKGLLAAAIVLEAGAGLGYADHLYREGEYYRAAGEYHRYLYGRPEGAEVPRALWGLGRAYMRGGRPEPAIKTLLRVPEADPIAPYARFTLGQAYIAAGRKPEAAQAFEGLAAPLRAPARLQLGRLAAERGAWEAARDHFAAAGAPELAGRAAAMATRTPPSPLVAGALSVVPGAGHLYLGRPEDALSAFTMPAGLALVSWYYLGRDQPAFAAAFGGLSAIFWGGAIYGAASEAARADAAAVAVELEAIRRVAEAADPEPR